MADVFDIFKKTKIVQPRSPSVNERIKQCVARSEEVGYCDCEMCVAKVQLANKLYFGLNYLCNTYTEGSGKDMYLIDALEIAMLVVQRVRNEIVKK